MKGVLGKFFNLRSEKSLFFTHHQNLHRDRNCHFLVHFSSYSFLSKPSIVILNFNRTFGQSPDTFLFKSSFPRVQGIDRRWPDPPMGVHNSFCMSSGRWTVNLVPTRRLAEWANFRTIALYFNAIPMLNVPCLLYTSDAADE